MGFVLIPDILCCLNPTGVTAESFLFVRKCSYLFPGSFSVNTGSHSVLPIN